IGIFQLGALGWGMHIVHSAKPIVVVHVYDTFHVLKKSDYEALGIDTSNMNGSRGPKIVYVDVEGEPIAFIASEIMASLNKKPPKYFMVEKYQKFPDDQDEIASLFHPNNIRGTDNCIRQNISSSFISGTVCFSH